MNRYIDADAALKRFEEMHGNESELLNGYNADWIVSFIEAQPTADVQEVKHGKWTIHHEGTYKRAKCYCSVCGKSNGIGGIISNQKKPYCPNCGAKMDLEDDK